MPSYQLSLRYRGLTRLRACLLPSSSWNTHPPSPVVPRPFHQHWATEICRPTTLRCYQDADHPFLGLDASLDKQSIKCIVIATDETVSSTHHAHCPPVPMSRIAPVTPTRTYRVLRPNATPFPNRILFPGKSSDIIHGRIVPGHFQGNLSSESRAKTMPTCVGVVSSSIGHLTTAFLVFRSAWSS